MKWIDPRIGIRTALALVGMVAAVAPQAGCRAPAPPNDPFLYRSTIPPPGTITAPPGGAQPYYSAPPGVAPAPTTVPPMISPGTPVTPQAAPLGPTSVPVTPAPVAPPSRYSPPGGFNYQSSIRSPMAAPQQTVSAPAALTRAPASDPAVVAAGNWQPLNSSSGAAPATASFTSQSRPDASVIRIIEPPKSAAAPPAADMQSTAAMTLTPVTTATSPASPAVAIPAAANSAAAPASSSGDSAAGPSSSSPPTAPTAAGASHAASNGASTTAVAQTGDSPAIPEITDLPPVSNATASARSPASATTAEKPVAATDGAKSDVAKPAPVNIPAQQPGTSFGYDPDYKTLRGQLEYSANSHRWKLNYLPAEGPIDEFGGSVVLPDASQLAGFEGGDFVTVTGAFSAPTAGAGSPMFSIQRIKRL